MFGGYRGRLKGATPKDGVSVLVLVDVWWVHLSLSGMFKLRDYCLGPCFSGCLVGTALWRLRNELTVWGLGPCFSGCLVGTVTHLYK